jgi:hypothetical protein
MSEPTPASSPGIHASGVGRYLISATGRMAPAIEPCLRVFRHHSILICVDLTQQSRYSPPLLRMHRQHVDNVGPVVPMSVAVPE